MMPVIIGWVLPLVLVFSCGWVALSAWTASGRAAARSRRSLLAALLQTAIVALAMRLVVDWTPVTIWLWVLSVAALAAAAAGTVIRWDSLPVHATVQAEPVASPERRSPEKSSPEKPGRRRQPRDPGPVALGGYAVLLAAAVTVSVAIG